MATYHTFGSGTYALNASISSTQTTITLSSFTEPVSGTPYTMALLNTDIAYGTIAPKTSQSEFISFTGITQNVDGTATLTGVVRGLAKKYPFTTSSTFKLPHSGQSVFIISNPPQVYEKYVSNVNDETVAGVKTFTDSPLVPSGATGTEAINYDDAAALASAGAANASTTVKGISRLSYSPNVTLGTCTITIATPAVITLASHGLTVNDMVQFTTTGALPTGIVASTTYYVISTGLTANDFEISATQGGSAINTTGSQSGTQTLIKVTPVAVATTDPRLPTQSENDALAGQSGTPSSTNKYETYDDTTTTNTPSKLIRLDGSGLLPSSVISQTIVGNNLTSTAGEDLVANDMLYPTANDTLKRYRPTGVTTSTALTKGVSGGQTTSKNFIISPTRMICVDFLNSATNYRDVVINPTTGDGSSESTTAYTANGANYGDATQFDSDKFLILWQNNTAAAASGIKARVLSLSGGLGSIATIETTGNLLSQVACTSLDATRALIAYQKDSDSKLYLQVLSISGTAITTNTAVNLPRTSDTSNVRVVLQKIDTDKVLVIYQDRNGSITNVIKTVVVSISGTTPSIGTAVSVVTNTSNNNPYFDLGIQYIQTDKAVAFYEAYGGGSGQPDTNLNAVAITVSGTTPTVGSAFEVVATPISFKTGIMQSMAFSTTVLGVPYSQGAAQVGFSLLQLQGTTITQISTSLLGASSIPAANPIGTSCIRTGVFKIQTGGYGSGSNFYITLTQPSTDQVSVANSSVSSSATVTSTLRFRTSTTQSGLSVGSVYYINDNGQPTTEVSNSAVQYGTALNATTMLIK